MHLAVAKNLSVRATVTREFGRCYPDNGTGYDPGIQFASFVSGGVPPYTYFWNFGDGSPLGSGSSVNHTYGYYSTFELSLTVRDPLSDVGWSNITATTYPPPGCPVAVTPYTVPLTWERFGLGVATILAIVASAITLGVRRHTLRRAGGLGPNLPNKSPEDEP